MLLFIIVYKKVVCERLNCKMNLNVPLVDTCYFNHISPFLSARELGGSVSCVSKNCRTIADNSIGWSYRCKELWQSKQNHPYEKWVRLKHEEPSEGATEFSTDWIVSDFVPMDKDFYNSCTDYDMYQLESGQNDIVKELNQMDKKVQKDSEKVDTSLLPILIDRLRSVRNLMNRRFSLQKQEELRSIEEAKTKGLQRRRSAPASRAMISERIKREIIILDELRLIDADGYAFIPDEKCMGLYSQDLDVKAYMIEAEREGRLLSWKDSYIESIIDSYRRRITYEELREQGDWILSFMQMGDFSVARMVHGGKMFLTHHRFDNVPGDIVLEGSRMYIRQLKDGRSIQRTEDWGWELIADNRFVSMYSFDREKGYEATVGHNNPTGYFVDKINPLVTKFNVAPLFSNYNCKCLR